MGRTMVDGKVSGMLREMSGPQNGAGKGLEGF